MAWYWIVLIVICYISAGIFIANCVDFSCNIEDGITIAALVLLWPLAAVIFLIIAVLMGFKGLVEWTFFEIVGGIQNLIDDIKYKIKRRKTLRISRIKSQGEKESSKV